MWAAAMLAAAFVTDDVETIIRAGLGEIPANCRLSSAIEDVLEWRSVDVDYDTAVYRLHEIWDETRAHDWCHTISNAMIVAIALLWGEQDYGKTICRAVQPCFDTDCNGATAGSVMGITSGPQKPARKMDRTDQRHTAYRRGGLPHRETHGYGENHDADYRGLAPSGLDTVAAQRK